MHVSVMGQHPYVSQSSRAYRPAEGGERACNSHTASTEGEMLAVTNNTLAVSL